MSLEFEKDFDDEVYEDSYYSDEEELEEDEQESDELGNAELDDPREVVDELDDSSRDLLDEETGGSRVDISFVCDDCDYRWDDSVVPKKNEFDEAEEITDAVCPMCGSMNVTQI